MFSGDADRVIAAARDAERLGFDGVFVFDHFFPPGAPPDRPALEAFTTLGAVIALTERVMVGTLVTRVTLRPVGMLAKLASWLDAASGGRFILGVGTGDPIDRPEHEAYGIPMLDVKGRRAHLQETLRALKELFAGRTFEGGEHVPAITGPLAPPSPRPEGPPIWIGGQADAVVGIAAQFADGWNGWGMDEAAFESKAQLLAAETKRAGRNETVVEATWAGIVLVGHDAKETEGLRRRRKDRGMAEDIWSGTVEELAAFGAALAAAGASWLVVVPAGPPDRLTLIGEEVLPALSNASAGGSS